MLPGSSIVSAPFSSSIPSIPLYSSSSARSSSSSYRSSMTFWVYERSDIVIEMVSLEAHSVIRKHGSSSKQATNSSNNEISSARLEPRGGALWLGRRGRRRRRRRGCTPLLIRLSCRTFDKHALWQPAAMHGEVSVTCRAATRIKSR